MATVAVNKPRERHRKKRKTKGLFTDSLSCVPKLDDLNSDGIVIGHVSISGVDKYKYHCGNGMTKTLTPYLQQAGRAPQGP